MEHLLQWIRVAEAVRATCQNASEFDALIRFQKQRLKGQDRSPEQTMANKSADEIQEKNIEKNGAEIRESIFGFMAGGRHSSPKLEGVR